MKEKISIRDVVKSMGLTTRTLRYYEELGLIQAVQEGRGNRYYTKDTLKKLIYLDELKNKGCSLKQIEELMGSKCCNEKKNLLLERIAENNKEIEYLKWQNSRIQEELDIIRKLDMDNVFMEEVEFSVRNYEKIQEKYRVEEDEGVERVWANENYDIREEKIYVMDSNNFLNKDYGYYNYAIMSKSTGEYTLDEGLYLVVYSREGLHKQKEIFEKMLNYIDKNSLAIKSSLYVQNKFRIFCKREKNVLPITKSFIKIEKLNKKD